MGQVQAQDGVSGLQHRRVGRRVGLRAGVRLHVGVLGAEDLFGAVAGQVLHHVGILASAVVAAARVALSIFIGKDGAGRLKHRLGNKVFAGNHLQPLMLAQGFVVKSGGDFRISLGKGKRHAIGHKRILAGLRRR